MKILIIANSRFKGGLSGGDAIYESFKKYWPCSFVVRELRQIDYKPFIFCYFHRLFLAVRGAFWDRNKYDFVYSASDFLPDSLPALVYHFRGFRWVAGFYLKAFKENKIHYYTQKIVRWLIEKFADMVIVTNPTMYDIFPNKKKTWINGGIDLRLAGLSDKPKIYDAVFCGRIHPSKGIDELLEIWDLVRESEPKARLAIIGDGDLGKDYIKHKLFARHGLNQYNGITLFGYMGDERFDIYKQSKVVLYPVLPKWDHFSMAPVEAMACGCPCVAFDLYTFRSMCKYYLPAESIGDFAGYILYMIENPEKLKEFSVRAIEYAQQFDYEKQSLRIYNDVIKELFNENSCHGRTRNGRERLNSRVA